MNTKFKFFSYKYGFIHIGWIEVEDIDAIKYYYDGKKIGLAMRNVEYMTIGLTEKHILKKFAKRTEFLEKKYGVKYNPIVKAYTALTKCHSNKTADDVDYRMAVEEAIGYISEALNH